MAHTTRSRWKILQAELARSDEPGFGFSSEMEDVVRASQTAMFVSRDEYPGFFDWDASSVTFKF